MKAVIVFALFLVIFVPIGLIEAYALGQTGGSAVIDIKPGESDTFVWGIISDKDESMVVKLSADGEGSQFLSFPNSISFGPNEKVYQIFQVTIPADYPGGITLRPSVYATDVGMDVGSTTINIQMAKTVTLNIGLNDNPSLRVDWEALKAEQQEETLQEETLQEVEPASQAKQEEEEPTSTRIEPAESTSQIKQESPGSTTILLSEPEMDPEPGVDFDVMLDPESQALQIDPPEGGGCLIATATYGSELAPQVQLLREIRDNMVLQTQSGDAFMTGFNQIYYSFSPTIADWERQNPAFKELVKLTITPMMTSLSILDYVDIETEAQMLGWGLSIIALNLTMYVAVPTLGSYKFSKYLRNRK